MKRRGILCLAFLCAAGLACAAGGPDRKQGAAGSGDASLLTRAVDGTFDMAKNPRPFIAFLILDQTNNVLPSFWCGRNVEGKLVFKTEVNPLDETLSVKQTGTFSVQITNAARKLGMFDRLPGGALVEGLREKDFKIAFEGFSNPRFTGVERREKGIGVQIEMACRGRVSVGGRSGPFTGTALFTFSEALPEFSLCVKFPVPGAELGLEGPKGGGITATLYTASTTGAVLKDATPGGAADVLDAAQTQKE